MQQSNYFGGSGGDVFSGGIDLDKCQTYLDPPHESSGGFLLLSCIHSYDMEVRLKCNGRDIT